MQSFTLNKKLQEDTLFVTDLSLSRLLLMNDQQYPWLILVPRVSGVEEIYQLDLSQQQQLLSEISEISQILNGQFNPIKINVAALGNIVRQLHIHIIARQTHDPAWPNPIWGVSPAKPYSTEQHKQIVEKIIAALKK